MGAVADDGKPKDMLINVWAVLCNGVVCMCCVYIGLFAYIH